MYAERVKIVLTMNDKNSECQTPFTKCWCEAVPGRMNNPHCQNIEALSIQSDFLTLVLVAGILIYMWRIFKQSNKL